MDKTHVIQILSKSFSDNKSVHYVVKQDQKNDARIKSLMEYSFDICHAFCEVWISNNDEACVLLLFPDKKWTSIRTILWDVKLALSKFEKKVSGRTTSIVTRKWGFKDANEMKDIRTAPGKFKLNQSD